MNEHLKISTHGIRLLTEFEKGPKDGSVELTHGGAAKSPYVCPGGELTIGYGCTKWFDGTEVEIHHRIETEEQARQLLDIQVDEYEAAVRRLSTRPLTQHQFDAYVCLCYNVGIGNFQTASALKGFNENHRAEDAASDFGSWTGATTDRPIKDHKSYNDPDYASKWQLDHKNRRRWIGQDGNYCRYMLRWEGLLRRHYAEACLFMGYDWSAVVGERGCVNLELVAVHPSKAKWNAKKNRWEDDVAYRTPFKEVLRYAQPHPLTDVAVVAPTFPVEKIALESAPFNLDAYEREAEELILDTPAPLEADAPSSGRGEQPAGQPPSAVSPAQKSAAASPAAEQGAGVSRPPAPGGASPSTASPVVAPAKLPPLLPPPPKPVQKPLEVPATTYAPEASNDPKDMLLSRRFWGLTTAAFGSLNFWPEAVSKSLADPATRELLSWLAVVLVGVVIYHIGKKKATRPLK